MSPSPRPIHNIVSFELASQLKPQLPDQFRIIQDIDVDLELVPPERPGFSRRPDLVVVDRAALDRGGDMLRAGEVLLVIEIVSPSSRRMDTVVKHGEYADAGIPHYWIVDLDEPLSLTACRLTAGHGYRNAPAATGTFATDEPFPLQLRLDALRG
jgi:Uma2 family endonuclease